MSGPALHGKARANGQGPLDPIGAHWRPLAAVGGVSSLSTRKGGEMVDPNSNSHGKNSLVPLTTIGGTPPTITIFPFADFGARWCLGLGR